MGMRLDPADAAADRSEAARYALLRRLAPSMRHHLVVNLQPIGMIYEVLDRRLRAPDPDLEHVHDSARRIHGFARAALTSCLDVVTWLAPEDGAVTTPEEGVRECLGLLATSLSFRGYLLRNEVGPIGGEVSRPAIRSVLTSALIQCTDETAAPAAVVISAHALPEGLQVRLVASAAEGDEVAPAAPAYRYLGWSDVRALADAEGVGVQRSGDERCLLFPWAAAGTA